MSLPSPAVSEILLRMRQVYSECASYEDTGEVTLSMEIGALRRTKTDVWRFSTAFRRPDWIRFECAEVALGPAEDWRRAVAWGRDGTVREWTSLRPGVK